jgi:hypothetical protein
VVGKVADPAHHREGPDGRDPLLVGSDDVGKPLVGCAELASCLLHLGEPGFLDRTNELNDVVVATGARGLSSGRRPGRPAWGP